MSHSVALSLSGLKDQKAVLPLVKTAAETVTVAIDLSTGTNGRDLASVVVDYVRGTGLSFGSPTVAGAVVEIEVSGGTAGTYHSAEVQATLSDGDVITVEWPLTVAR